jgi:hypothetical protein
MKEGVAHAEAGRHREPPPQRWLVRGAPPPAVFAKGDRATTSDAAPLRLRRSRLANPVLAKTCASELRAGLRRRVPVTYIWEESLPGLARFWFRPHFEG